MSLTKVNYIDNSTIITAKNLNDIQDNIIQNAELIKKVAPRNLLDNSDFTNPVNQRGQTSWNTHGYTIDRWDLQYMGDSGIKLVDGGIKFATTSNNLVLLRQVVPAEVRKRIIGKTVTAAAKTSDGRIWCSSCAISEVGVGIDSPQNEIGGLKINIYAAPTEDTLAVRLFSGSIATPIIVEWVALYEGEYTIDTLPEYQPKGYGAELLICRQYDPDTGEYIGLRKFGQPRNLLDNSDFRNPVNQRGQSSYIYGYCIDRWFFYNEDSQNPKLEVKNGYIHIEANTKHNFAQRLPLTIDTEKIYTLAYKPLIGDVVIKYRRPIISDGFCYVSPYECDTGGSIDLVWCAMYEGEYTIETLPEYQPKGYGAELAECQRYFLRYNNDSIFTGHCDTFAGQFLIPTPVTMRILPTIIASNMYMRCNGTDYEGTNTRVLSSDPGYVRINIEGNCPVRYPATCYTLGSVLDLSADL